MLAPQERKEIVRKLPALANAHGVSKCRDDASKDAVLRMVAALRQKTSGVWVLRQRRLAAQGASQKDCKEHWSSVAHSM